MISIFRSNLILSPFILFGLTFILRLYDIIHNVSYEMNGGEGPLFKFIYSLVGHPYLEQIVLAFLIFVQAFLTNRLVLRDTLMKPPNFYPAFFYLIFASLAFANDGFSPVLLASTFIILGCFEFFRIYKLFKSAIHIFNGGLLFSIASLIYPPCVILYVCCSIIILILRSYNIKERIQLLLGFTTPVYLLAIYFYLTNDLSAIKSTFSNMGFYLHRIDFTDQLSMASISIYVLFVLSSILYYRRVIIKKGIQIEKKLSSLYWIMLFVFFMIFLIDPLTINHLGLLAFPLSILIGSVILTIKQGILVELFGILSLVAAFFINFYL